MPTFANPLGLLALLGIPAVLAIHFLQRRARELPVSTLFLLQHTRREAAGGRRLERLIPSIPLWMQLLAVCLLAWFLAEPRYTKSGSVQRVAIVMDSSASMSVFKDKAISRLNELLPSMKGAAAAIEITVLESAPNRQRLYAGSSAEELRIALENWQPLDGPIDPTQSLRLARSLVSREGTVIFLTDTPVDNLPYNTRLLALGEPVENAGFTGVTFATEEGALVWRAMVRNYGSKSLERTWRIETSDGSSEERPLHLDPGALVTLQAAFPKQAKNVCIVLTADRFTLDDVLPLVPPKPKPITLFAATSPARAGLADKLLHSLDAAETTADASSADLCIINYNPLDPVTPSGNSFVFVEDETSAGAWLKGGIIAKNDPLMDGLNWQTLLVRETIQLPQDPADKILLWQEKRPLILLREIGNTRQLRFNFDPALSNAEKQPAFIVLLHRFSESIRAAKIAPVFENLETGQILKITSKSGVPLSITATDPAGKELAATDLKTAQHAIPTPGFMIIQQNKEPLLTAAVHFGDPRESDFSACRTSDFSGDSNIAAIERHTRADPLWRLWILLLLAALLLSWKFIAKVQPA